MFSQMLCCPLPVCITYMKLFDTLTMNYIGTLFCCVFGQEINLVANDTCSNELGFAAFVAIQTFETFETANH